MEEGARQDDILYITTSSQYQESTDIKAEETFTDVLVFMENGDIYTAAFYSYPTIEHLRREHIQNGNYLGGAYFTVPQLVLTHSCQLTEIERIVRHMIEEGDFWMVFRKL
ncbi:MAG: hypothetical protein AAF824_08785 [Bacteroidota bacterium]